MTQGFQRVVHIAAESARGGGAAVYLRGLVTALRGSVEQTCIADGVDEARFDLRSLDKKIARLRPCLLHLHNVMSPALLDWAAQRGAVCTVQDHRSFCPGPGKWIPGEGPCRQVMSESQCRACLGDDAYRERMLNLTRARLQALKGMAAVTVLSHYMKRELVNVGLEAQRVRVIPPAIFDIQPDATPITPRAVIFVGRLVRAKGVSDVIAAWRQSGVDLPLRFVGTGPLRQKIEAQSFEVTGWQSHAQLSSHYAAAAALLLPSRWQEPFGIVGLEALAFGVPVIAWRSGGVEEWHPGDACLVDWGDVDALAAALRGAIDLRAELPSGYSLSDLAAAHRQLYAERTAKR